MKWQTLIKLAKGSMNAVGEGPIKTKVGSIKSGSAETRIQEGVTDLLVRYSRVVTQYLADHHSHS